MVVVCPSVPRFHVAGVSGGAGVPLGLFPFFWAGRWRHRTVSVVVVRVGVRRRDKPTGTVLRNRSRARGRPVTPKPQRSGLVQSSLGQRFGVLLLQSVPGTSGPVTQ